jgi:hypothetical protein
VWILASDIRHMNNPASIVEPQGEKSSIESVAAAIEIFDGGNGLDEIRPDREPKQGDAYFGFWFRGHSSTRHLLVPTILRKSIGQDGSYVDEVSLVRHFKAMNWYVVQSASSDFEILVTMQHYLAPTRLLDWTENLLVALRPEQLVPR